MKQTTATITCDACGAQAEHTFKPAPHERTATDARAHYSGWFFDAESGLDFCPQCPMPHSQGEQQ